MEDGSVFLYQLSIVVPTLFRPFFFFETTVRCTLSPTPNVKNTTIIDIVFGSFYFVYVFFLGLL